MAQLPERRIERSQQGHGEIGSLECILVLAKQVQRMITRIDQRERKQRRSGIPHQRRINQVGCRCS